MKRALVGVRTRLHWRLYLRLPIRRLAGLGLCCLLQAMPAWSQSPPVAAIEVPAPDSEAFARIEATRTRETATLDAQEAACYQRFAVSACVKDVQSRRRAMLAGLRQQEAVLHERQFAAQGAEQLRRTAQKVEERKQQDLELQASRPAQQRDTKLRAQQEKQAEHAQSQAQAEKAAVPSTGLAGKPLQTSTSTSPPAPAPVAAATATAPAASGLTPAEQALNRASFARKQADLEKKRRDIAKRLAEKGTKPAAPLPVPP